MLLAEFADKTSLVAISLATKSKKPVIVFFGSLSGITITSVVAIGIALIVGQVIPDYIRYVSGLIFIFLGLLNLIQSKKIQPENLENGNNTQSNSKLFVNCMLTIALAEMGDKSQLFLIARSLVDNPFAILLGAIMGMTIILGLSIYFGQRLNEIVPEETLERIVGILFLIIGFWILLS